MGFRALALTDHGNMGGTIKFLQECYTEKQKDGSDYPYPPIKFLPGMEAYCSKNRFAKDTKLQPNGKKGNHHLILIAKNFEGYQNLCTLSNRSYTEGFYHSPRIDLELLQKYSKGIICQSACPSSMVNANLLHGRYDQAKKAATILKDIFREDFFLEVMYHGISIEEMIIPDIFKLGSELKIPVLATNDTHYTFKEQGSSHEVLMAMSTSKCIADPKHLHFPYDEFYLKSAEEMGKIWGDRPEVLTNTLAVADRVDIEDIKKNLFGVPMRLPVFKVPAQFYKAGRPHFENSFDYMRHLSYEGLERNGWKGDKRHVDVLEKELSDIRIAFTANKFDFATYFLILWDYINFAKKNKIIVGGGRGSGCASILLRCLGATYGYDPIDYKLIWERFLGFSDLRYISLDDLGLRPKKQEAIIVTKDDTFEERDLENDEGGVDRHG